MKKGVTLVDETGRALQSIITEVAEININVQAIVEASREQAIGLKEINNAINLMDQNTQQNAAMVEESNAASHGLAKEAGALRDLINRFSIGKHSSSSLRIARPDARPVASPARSLMAKVARASTGAAAAVQASENWEEF